MPRGGARPGAGRKPGSKNKPRLTLVGSQGAVGGPSSAGDLTVPEPTEPVAMPEDLTTEQRQVWERQAPHALRQGTLTPSKAFAFARYCRIAVLEANEAKSSAVGGPNHRGLLKLVNELELQFQLTANGDSVAEPTPVPQAPAAEDGTVVNRLAKFRS